MICRPFDNGAPEVGDRRAGTSALMKVSSDRVSEGHLQRFILHQLALRSAVLFEKFEKDFFCSHVNTLFFLNHQMLFVIIMLSVYEYA